LLPCIAAQSTEKPIKDKWALVVGINQFRSGHNLHFAASDAKSFADYLIENAGFAPDHVKLLTDRDASRLNIIKAIGEDWLPRRVDEDDLVVIYMGTHGSSDKSDIIGSNYLITSDTEGGALYSTAIPTQDFLRIIRTRIPARNVVLVLDACFSGAAQTDERAGWAQGIDADEIFAGTKQVVICSSAPGEVAFEAPELRAGVFTHFLADNLKSSDRITIKESFDKASQQVIEHTHGNQHPILKTKPGGEELILASKSTL
jgi:uncharacterized caspase-like protein